MSNDNRTSKRSKSNVWVKELRDDYFFLRNATNFSNGGMYIDNAIALQPNKEFTYVIHLPNSKEIKFKGKIIHSHNEKFNKGYGVKFLDFEKGSPSDLVESFN